MPLLAEYAITPDIFQGGFSSDSDYADELLLQIKDVLLTQGIVRDLRNGEWSSLFSQPDRYVCLKAKELLKKISRESRLSLFPPQLPSIPESDSEWCSEALETHKLKPLQGIIATEMVAEMFKGTATVESIKKLRRTEWWRPLDSGSVQVQRNIKSYLSHLNLIIEKANCLLFIDGNLDPTSWNYSEFTEIVKLILQRERMPLVEIHRQQFSGSSKNRQDLTVSEWRDRFAAPLVPLLKETRLQIDVYIWDRIHDRYLLSNLAGIMLPYGFDTNKRNPEETTTWSRISREVCDCLFRDFDKVSRQHNLVGKFTIKGNDV